MGRMDEVVRVVGWWGAVCACVWVDECVWVSVWLDRSGVWTSRECSLCG